SNQLTPLEESAVKMFFESLKPIQPVLEEATVAEVMINHHNSVWVERKGRLERLDLMLEPKKLEGAIRALASSVEK
ncbi:hypothetical protein, partial [Stenotrophomonas maltophilia]